MEIHFSDPCRALGRYEEESPGSWQPYDAKQVGFCRSCELHKNTKNNRAILRIDIGFYTGFVSWPLKKSRLLIRVF